MKLAVNNQLLENMIFPECHKDLALCKYPLETRN